MRIVSSTPADGGSITVNEPIQLVFDKELDPNSFTTQMLVLEHNNVAIDNYTYEISGNTLSISIPGQSLGNYYLFFTGYDLLNNKYLVSVDGDKFVGQFSLEFTITHEDGTVEEDNTTVPTDSVVILTDAVNDVSVTYPKLLLTHQFEQQFSQKIAKDFEIQISVENFDGSYLLDQYTVTTTSTPAFYQEDKLIVNFGDPLTNSIVTISTVGDIEFQNGQKKTFEFILLTQLKPYINLKQSLSQLGSYAKEIQEHELWYQALSQMIAYEQNFSESIIGQDVLNPRVRMFLQKYQYLELLTLLLNRKILHSGDSINTGIQSISFGRVNNSQIQLIEQQKQELVSQFSLVKPVSQNKQIQNNIALHSRALQQLKIWEETFGAGGDF